MPLTLARALEDPVGHGKNANAAKPACLIRETRAPRDRPAEVSGERPEGILRLIGLRAIRARARRLCEPEHHGESSAICASCGACWTASGGRLCHGAIESRMPQTRAVTTVRTRSMAATSSAGSSAQTGMVREAILDS